jgi:hypothetical protein
VAEVKRIRNLNAYGNISDNVGPQNLDDGEGKLNVHNGTTLK